jgi:hypothetical protein
LGHAKKVLDTSLCELTPQELQAVQKQAFWRFYFRHKYILRKIMQLRSLGELFNLLRGAYLIVLFQLQTLLNGRCEVNKNNYKGS